ncbi:MAG: hypothetical protein J4428_05255 [Candidatus Aenigmarchaeota archaeon]|nr:hypothetical protein [Candidatus Aenigmarchaeota archaeon]
MGFKSVFSSVFPFILFFLAFFSLYSSSITLPKIITVQYKIFEIFMNSLKTNSLAYSFEQAFSYLWTAVLMNSSVALMLISIGTVITIRYVQETNSKLVILSAIVFLTSVFFTTNSIELSITAVALVIFHLITIRFFEPKKYSISTGYAYVKRNITIVTTVLSLCILALMTVNSSLYEKEIHETTVKSISLVLPNTNEIVAAQKEKVNTDSEFIRSFIIYSQESLPIEERQSCQKVYTGCLTAVDEYEKASIESTEKNGIGLAVEDIQNSFPIIKSFEKTTPIFISILIFTLLSALSPIASIFGGLLYLILNTIKRNETKDEKNVSTK